MGIHKRYLVPNSWKQDTVCFKRNSSENTKRWKQLYCSFYREVATILESIPGYVTDSDGGDPTKVFIALMGVQKVGLLNNRFTVYKNPYMTENVILVGFRGSNFLETGVFVSLCTNDYDTSCIRPN